MSVMKSITTTTLTAALAGLTLAACGDGEGADADRRTGASPADRAFEGALRFARCMRGEGLDFPDPRRDSRGLIRMGPAPRTRLDPRDPKVEAAQAKCGRHLREGGGEPPDAATRARLQDAFVKYARCMRAEGVDVPDPKPGQEGLVFRRGDPNAPDPESARFKQADRVCHRLLAEVDRAVSGERTR
jgi:hypothetical protein